MRKITLLAALFISMMFVACQESDLELAQMENLTDGSQIIPLRETFDFTYKGVTYSSPYYIQGDTLMVLEDEKVAAVYENLQELPELATRIKDNGDVEYFDSYSELEKVLQPKNKPMTRYYESYIIDLYEHSEFNTQRNGAKLTLVAPVEIYNLGPYNMDELISSFRARGSAYSLSNECGITFFRNIDYGAQSLTFTYKMGIRDNVFPDQINYIQIPNFKNYKIKKGINWNDRISSLKTFQN